MNATMLFSFYFLICQLFFKGRIIFRIRGSGNRGSRLLTPFLQEAMELTCLFRILVRQGGGSDCRACAFISASQWVARSPSTE